jgi:hypothetical protein
MAVPTQPSATSQDRALKRPISFAFETITIIIAMQAKTASFQASWTLHACYRSSGTLLWGDIEKSNRSRNKGSSVGTRLPTEKRPVSTGLPACQVTGAG